jgi:membrane protein YdbS with pleckstrin-like domain
MSWRDLVLSLLRVPPDPEPPPGTPPRVFRAASNFLKLRTLRFVLLQLFGAAFAISVMIVFFAAMRSVKDFPPLVVNLFRVLETLTWMVFIAQFIFNLSILRLDYELRWYMVSDRAIRVREGITTVREKTITLANIQNIGVKQGPLQRLLGIADVEVKTAGGGGSAGGKHGHQRPGESLHVAYFRGVANANEIRDLLLEGVRRQKDAGLGDHDDHQPVDEIQLAISELLAAARGLRAGLERT